MGRAQTVSSVIAFLWVFAATPCNANTFLKKANVAEHLLHGEDLSRDFLNEIERVLGSEHREATERRLAPMEVLLRPTLGAVPRNEHGRFGHMAVKYALHRLFIKRHGWLVHGFHADGSEEKSNSATNVLAEGVPEYVQGLFEARMGSHGLSAHEVALLAATLENLVHREVLERLQHAYSLVGIDSAQSTSVEQADVLIDTYMALYLADNMSAIADHDYIKLITDTEKTFPLWKEAQRFVREVRADRLEQRSATTAVSLADMTDIVERIADRYGRFQNVDCRALKKEVLTLQDDGSGMVPLSKFYAAALGGQWQFSESRVYLRSIGALDETSPEKPQVIVPNYVLGPSNCVGSSIYYSQCCISECEEILENLEREIGEPDATPERILSLVKGLASASEPANRVLKPKIVQRLQEIADGRGGRVDLHGRMFAQWLNHVYPRECPFPHVEQDKALPLTLASPQQMEELVRHSQTLAEMEPGDASQNDETSPWVDVEVHFTDKNRSRTKGFSFFRVLAFLAAGASVVRFLSQIGAKSMASVIGDKSMDKAKLV